MQIGFGWIFEAQCQFLLWMLFNEIASIAPLNTGSDRVRQSSVIFQKSNNPIPLHMMMLLLMLMIKYDQEQKSNNLILLHMLILLLMLMIKYDQEQKSNNPTPCPAHTLTFGGAAENVHLGVHHLCSKLHCKCNPSTTIYCYGYRS